MAYLKGRAWPWAGVACLVLIVLLAVAVRLPYWETIPASFDEVEQTSYAYLIADGQILPLVGNDAYAGPFYFYLVAALLKLGITNPMIGRVVILVAGILTVPAVYAWVLALGKDRLAALLAALFTALNADLILINSHLGGTTLLMPLLTTLFLLALTLSAERDSLGWLLAAGVLGGLAAQSNLVAGLAVAGGLLWFLWRVRGRLRLGSRWPLWPIILGSVILLVFSPVIIYNLRTGFGSVAALEGKSYLWETNPTVATTLDNARRFFLQLVRQASGVLTGREDFATLVGLPLLYLALMAGGLAYTTRRVSAQPLLVILPYALVLPVISSHYGFSSIGRFTGALIPVWTAVIAFLLAAGAARVGRVAEARPRWILGGLLAALLLLLLIPPVVGLFCYYDDMVANHRDGRTMLELTRYAVDNNQGEPVYISAIEELGNVRGIPYVPHAAYLLAGIHHEFLPPGEIIGRLYERPGPAFFILSDRDAAAVAEAAPLERVALPANEIAALQGYSLYWLASAGGLARPDFVLSAADVPAGLAPVVTFGESVQLLGCAAPQVAADALTLDCYWQAVGEPPSQQTIAFAHLLLPDGSQLVAQDDHILGQQRYPLNAWQPGEVVRESYRLPLPDGAAGEFRLQLGIYTWPEQVRLAVPGNADNVAVPPPVLLDGGDE